MSAVIYDPDEGQVFGEGDRRIRVLARDPDDPLAITENTLPAGFRGPIPHRHARTTDIFYVLEGELTLHLASGPRTLTAGGFALVPPGTVHSFSNDGASRVRFLNIYHPPELVQYVIDVAGRLAAGQQVTPAEMAEIAAPHDFIPEPRQA